MSSEFVEMFALGRPFDLGMLYDGLRDKPIPGLTLWDEATLKTNTNESPQSFKDYEVFSHGSVESKSSLLNVDVSLKSSFLSGLIDVGGSAKYQNDKKKFKNQSRVILQYNATTIYKHLVMPQLANLNEQQKNLIERSSATHVVTSILYGVNAGFAFENEKIETSRLRDIQSGMEAVIKKIPSLPDPEGKGNVKLTEEEKALTEKFSCKFYGNIDIGSNPATYEDAVKTYKLLKNVEIGVPLKVWMIPLKTLGLTAPEVKTEVSDGLLRKADNFLGGLHLLDQKCNDFLEEKVMNEFPKIQEKWSTFQKLCIYYRDKFKKTMEKKLPLIRAGEEDEDELQEIIESIYCSSFSLEKLTKWTDDDKRQFNIIRSCVKMMEGIKIVQNQSELDEVVFAPGVEDVLCFVFTSLETTEPYLQAMADFIDSLKSHGAQRVTPPAQEQWYYSDEVTTKMRENAKTIHDIFEVLKNNSRSRFLIAAITNEKHKGGTIYHYRNTCLVTEDFSKPVIAEVEDVKDRRELMWYARDLALDPDVVNKYDTLSESYKKATCRAKQLYPEFPLRFDRFHQDMWREGFTGCCYWEVDWSTGKSEDVDVIYKGKFRVGEDDWCQFGQKFVSWLFGHRRRKPSQVSLYEELVKQGQILPLPSSGCTRLGVFLDWPAGTLSFYDILSDTLSHRHTFRIQFFESPVKPAMSAYEHICSWLPF